MKSNIANQQSTVTTFRPSMTRNHGRLGVRRDSTPTKIETIFVVADPIARRVAIKLTRSHKDILIAADVTVMGVAAKGVHQVVIQDNNLQALRNKLPRSGTFGPS